MQGERVVVVGGGLAGLMAAAVLARDGVPVTLFEAARTLGGRARTQRRNGFDLNLGPHALYRHGAGIEHLRALGLPLHGGVPSPDGIALFEGEMGRLPTTPVGLMTSRLLGARARLEAARFFLRWPTIDSAPLAGISVDAWIDDTLRDPVLRRLVRALVRLFTYAAESDHLSAAAAIEQGKIGISGNVLYLDGGWQGLVDGVAAAARAAGARLVTGARVEALEQEGTQRTLRLAGGERVPAAAILLAVPPAAAAALAGREIARRGRWLEGQRPVLAATMELGLSHLPIPARRLALGVDEPLYYSVHSAWADLAPKGGALLHLARYLRSDETDDRSEQMLEGLADQLQPGWRDHLVHRRFLPRMVVANHLPLAARGGRAGRPPVDVPGADSLFIAGDWVGERGLLADAALASGHDAAKRIAARYADRRPARDAA